MTEQDLMYDGLTAGERAPCRSCGITVLFRFNPRTGKTPPYEVDRQACPVCARDEHGKPAGKDALGLPCAKCSGEAYVFVSHFATCRDAAAWKGKARR